MGVNWKWLCKEVCKVVGAFTPRNNELLLFDAVADPVEAHVDAFGAFRFNGVQCDTLSAFVVA